jgi:DNA invertase Pin-like site-specific DNA recombinase
MLQTRHLGLAFENCVVLKNQKTKKPKNQEERFAYLCVSSDGQAGEDRDGLKRQERAITAFAKARKYKVAQWFSNEGVSGTTHCNTRPGSSNLLAHLYGDGITVVLIESVDRLARDAEASLIAIGDFRPAGFQLIAASSGQDLTDPGTDQKLKTGLDVIIAEFVRGQLVQRFRSARQNARLTKPGWRGGRKPFGMDPDETETIAEDSQASCEGACIACASNRGSRTSLNERFGEAVTLSEPEIDETPRSAKPHTGARRLGMPSLVWHRGRYIGDPR